MPATAKVVTQQKGVTTNTDDDMSNSEGDNNENDTDFQSFLEMYGIQAGPTLEVEVNLVKRLILTSSINSITN